MMKADKEIGYMFPFSNSRSQQTDSSAHKGIVSILVITLLVLLSSCSTTPKKEVKGQDLEALIKKGSWLTFLADIQRIGGGVGEITPPLRLYWKHKLVKGFGIGKASSKRLSPPAIYNGIAYIGTPDKRFLALTLNRRSILWRFDAGGAIESSPTIHGDTVYFGTTDGKLYAINRNDGNQIWVFKANHSIISSPLVTDKSVIFKTSDGKLYALNLDTGALLWEYIADISGTKVYAQDHTSPAYYKGVVYTVFSNGLLVAIDSEDGREIFHRDLRGADDKEIFIPHKVVVDHGLIYTIGSAGILTVLDDKGKEIWSFNRTDVEDFAVTRNRLILINSEGIVFSLNKVTGESLWKRTLSSGRPTGVAFTNNHLIISSIHESTVFDLEFLKNINGFIDILNIDNGEELWSYKTSGGISYGPLVIEDRVIFTTDKGYLYVFASSK